MISEPLDNRDVPVLLIGFNRPDYLLDRILELNEMPIKHLFISIDGNLKTNLVDFEPVITITKNIFTNLDSLVIERFDENLGLVDHLTSAITKVFQSFNHVIVVEDDIALTRNFYVNMLNGFNLQRDLNLSGIIGGFSPMNFSRLSKLKNHWRVSKYCSIWGWGCTKSAWNGYSFNLQQIDFESTLTESKSWNNLNKFQKNLWVQRFKKAQTNPNFTWDIQLQYHSFLNNFQNIYPLSTLVKNVGFMDYRATHTKNRKPNWMSSLNGDNRLITRKGISRYSSLISKLLDANTVAGDTKLNKFWSNL